MRFCAASVTIHLTPLLNVLCPLHDAHILYQINELNEGEKLDGDQKVAGSIPGLSG